MLSKIVIDTNETFDLSPNLYMQFMEPLGATEGSVEAGWDHERMDWRQDLVKVTKELAPPLIRFGGCLSSYYRWKEGVGPRPKRIPMQNQLWGGIESNQVGTHEFTGFCKRVGAQALYCVNFESDGRQHWARPAHGGIRSAGPSEAAAWVDYCNNPDNQLRKKHGVDAPYKVNLWQIGNETSYDHKGFDRDTAVRKTVEFSKAMRKKDPSIKLIGWGDSGWSKEMLRVAGEHLDYLAFHNMFDPSEVVDSPLRFDLWRKDPQATWDHLMEAYRFPEKKILQMREETDGVMPLAITECHFALPGRNRCEVLSTWAAGVANARILNVHERNGDLLKIATLSDFFGTRWLVNSILIPTPLCDQGQAFMLPVARVMALYRRHSGSRAVEVVSAPSGLDITASKTGKKVFLHVINTQRSRSIKTKITIEGMRVLSACSFEISASPELEIDQHNAGELEPQKRQLPKTMHWEFPSASVSAIELELS